MFTQYDEGSGYPANSVHGRIVHKIGGDIVGKRLLPGEKLPREAELMTEFGSSRSAVRDAVKVLASKGLVRTRQRGGTQICEPFRWNAFDIDILTWRFAAGIDLAFVDDLVELRLATEPYAARLAATRAKAEDTNSMEAALSRMRANTSDWSSYVMADEAFHMTLFAASHNQFLTRLGTVVHNLLRTTFHAEQLFAKRDGAEVHRVITADIALHTDLFEAITRGDPVGAEEYMKTIITFARGNLSRAVSEPR